MYNGLEAEEFTRMCDNDEIARILNLHSTYISIYIAMTVSIIVLFFKTNHIVRKLRRDTAQVTIIIVGAGPIGLTSALIALHCKWVRRIVLYEQQSKQSIERRSYQIALQSSQVSMLKGYGVDFDYVEGLWYDECFYTRAGIYLEYIMRIMPLFKREFEIKFNTKFTGDTRDIIDKIPGRKLVICCDGSSGVTSETLGLNNENVMHSSGVFGAIATIERSNQILVPLPETRVHNLSFDLSAYGPSAYECNEHTMFTLKIFGNSQCRHMALAVNRCDSGVVRQLRSVLDKSMMRNIFLKCYNTYKRSNETTISDSYCLNNMKFSPRLYEIKLLQRVETAAYIADCDMFVTCEGEAARSYNYSTGLDINIGLKGLATLQDFIQKISTADGEHSIVKSVVFKIKHSEKMCREILTFGLNQHLFT